MNTSGKQFVELRMKGVVMFQLRNFISIGRRHSNVGKFSFHSRATWHLINCYEDQDQK